MILSIANVIAGFLLAAPKLKEWFAKHYIEQVEVRLNNFKTPIIVVYLNSIEEAMNIGEKLFNECHIWAPAIRPPTVKEPRIRLTPISTHSQDDIEYVIKAFDYLAKDIKPQPLGISN